MLSYEQTISSLFTEAWGIPRCSALCLSWTSDVKYVLEKYPAELQEDREEEIEFTCSTYERYPFTGHSFFNEVLFKASVCVPNCARQTISTEQMICMYQPAGMNKKFMRVDTKNIFFPSYYGTEKWYKWQLCWLQACTLRYNHSHARLRISSSYVLYWKKKLHASPLQLKLRLCQPLLHPSLCCRRAFSLYRQSHTNWSDNQLGPQLNWKESNCRKVHTKGVATLKDKSKACDDTNVFFSVTEKQCNRSPQDSCLDA